MNQDNHFDLDRISADAAKWRELSRLLHDKAYNAMSPEEIAREFPDLRQLYREMDHRENGHGRRAFPS